MKLPFDYKKIQTCLFYIISLCHFLWQYCCENRNSVFFHFFELHDRRTKGLTFVYLLWHTWTQSLLFGKFKNIAAMLKMFFKVCRHAVQHWQISVCTVGVLQACYRLAKPFKHPKLQKFSDLRSNFIFIKYLAESVKCFDLSIFYLPWLAQNRDSQHTSMTQLNTK